MRRFALIRCFSPRPLRLFCDAPAADDVPTATPTPRAAPLSGASSQLLSMYDVIQDKATSIATARKASNDGPAGGTVVAEVPTAAPRAAPQARSYPRSFNTYDALVDYATDVATRQAGSNDRLAELTVRDDAAKAALAEVFDPRVRGGLLQSRHDVIDDMSLKTLRTQLANDAATRSQLLAEGAVMAPASSWHLPLSGMHAILRTDPYWFGPSHLSGTPTRTPTQPISRLSWGTPSSRRPGFRHLAAEWATAQVVVIAHDGGLVSLYAHLGTASSRCPKR